MYGGLSGGGQPGKYYHLLFTGYGSSCNTAAEGCVGETDVGGHVTLSPWTGVQLVGVDGSPLDVFGKADITITIEDMPFTAMVIVVRSLTTDAILGLDFLQQHGATIHLPSKRLLLDDGADGVQVPLKSPHIRKLSLLSD